MTQIELTPEELELTTRILKNYLPNLREEVYKTENSDWREARSRTRPCSSASSSGWTLSRRRPRFAGVTVFNPERAESYP